MLKHLIPWSVKNYIAKRRNTFYFLLHNSEMNMLAREELKNNRSLSLLRNEFSSMLEAMPSSTISEIPCTRIIWWCWLQGEDAAPPLCKACLSSLRRQLPEYEIRVVTEKNMFDYIHVPHHIEEKYKKGIISRTHFSDILRTLLLVEHGGVWIDSTVYCTGYHFPLFDYPLFVFQNWKFDIEQSTCASSWLISAQKGHPLLCAVRDLLFYYWERHDDLCNYYVFHLLFKMATEKFVDFWNAVPRFSNIPPHILQFELFSKYEESRFSQITAMSDFHKLTWKHQLDDKELTGTNYEYVLKNIM